MKADNMSIRREREEKGEVNMKKTKITDGRELIAHTYFGSRNGRVQSSVSLFLFFKERSRKKIITSRFPRDELKTPFLQKREPLLRSLFLSSPFPLPFTKRFFLVLFRFLTISPSSRLPLLGQQPDASLSSTLALFIRDFLRERRELHSGYASERIGWVSATI